MKYAICLIALLCLVSAAPACDPFAPVPSVGYSYSTYTSGYGLPVYDPAAAYYRQQLLLQSGVPYSRVYYPLPITARLPLTVVRNRGAVITIIP